MMSSVVSPSKPVIFSVKKKKRKVEPNQQCTGRRNYVLVKDPTNGKSEILYLSARQFQLLH